MAASAIPLPKALGWPVLEKTLKEAARITKIVVIFMPPAVDPGLPPISIRTMVMALPEPDMAM